ncbi:MAG: hypothetical protein V1667_01330 [bacterium]
MRKKILILFVFAIFFSFIVYCSVKAVEISPDAVAVRVVANPEHYSPLAWYKKNIKTQGSPQKLSVNGYEAIRDGRTVYVNAANISGSSLYTNIYIISYNQQAESQTEDIFGQMIAHWKFNTNIPDDKKGKVKNDVRRLADFSEIKLALENYKNSHGYYPKLSAGSYVANNTVSVWPSWKETLSKELNIDAPVDPVNKLGSCAGYDAATCWNESAKKFADPSPDNGVLDLPAGSFVYIYSVSPDGSKYSLTASAETGEMQKDGNIKYTESANNINFQASISNYPVITGVNLPDIIRRLPYGGYISAKDPKNGSLSWELALNGDWSSWSAPKLRDTKVKDQKEFYSTKAGATGDYNFTITVKNASGGSVSGSYVIKVINNCVDNDGDGYGVCPNCGINKGCDYEGNDCDDIVGVHSKAIAKGAVMIDGKQINPAQPDDCSQFEGVDNNCDGKIDNHAETTVVIGSKTQDMEDINPETGWPYGWLGSGQSVSKVAPSSVENHTSGGSRSILLHQDANRFYAGSCAKSTCTDANVAANTGCMWDEANQKCYFPRADACHDGTVMGSFNNKDYRSAYNNGEWMCWGNTNTVSWGYLQYNLSEFPFNLNDDYILGYYYKGKSNFQNVTYSSIHFSTGGGTCYTQGSFVYWPCDTFIPPYSGYRSLPGDPTNCSEYNLGGVINRQLADKCICLYYKNSAAHQTDCYTGIGMGGFKDGVYNDWTYYSAKFKYDSELDKNKNINGNRQLFFGLTFGYNNTGAGTDVYIDDLSLLQCKNK